MSASYSYTVTSVVGEDSPPDSYSADISYMTPDGEIKLSGAANDAGTLDPTNPIQQITVSTGVQDVIDGLYVTYNIKEGNPRTTVMKHGSSVKPPSGVVSFGENEVLASVYGYAGFYAWYRGTRIGSIAFELYDTVTKKTRTVGPFGDTTKERSFSVSDVVAFGSFGQKTTPTALSGLVFFKNNQTSSVDTTPIQASGSTN